ncbi:hypothetical protein [Streptomyces carpinensis]|uniref:TetR family transcriptional regulator n=1 Tax=Streptomyces carpinensis TaxID=66369 RepID=A0ABV1W3Y0_9ACTN|nr:hypothetical protein [Streptomyces carpinensis]
MTLRSGAVEWIGPVEAPHGLLEAARRVFAERGFSGSRLSDTVRRADWGDSDCRPIRMDDLFVALWAEHQAAHDAATSRAVAQARQLGVSDPGQLFESGARAYLEGAWQRRDLVLLFSSGDAPHGFAAIERRRFCQWIRRNVQAFGLADRPEDRLYVQALTLVVGQGSCEVAAAGNFRQAGTVIDAVLGYARVLLADKPRAANHGGCRYVGLRSGRGLGTGS